VAIQNARLSAELRQRAADSERLHRQLAQVREMERTRIARELHDKTVQGLVGIDYQLAKAQRRLGRDDDHLARLQTYTRYLMREARQICADLRSPLLDTQGLVGAMHGLVRTVKETTDLEVELSVAGDNAQSTPEEVAVCLLGVAKEALVNVQKHAEATRVMVRLALEPKELWLIVEDNGQGFQVPQRLDQLIDEQHFGLVGMREQVEMVNGRLDIVSTSDSGTRLRVWVPLVAPTVQLPGKEIAREDGRTRR
jgi:two-component system sensor histidine kinase DegS